MSHINAPITISGFYIITNQVFVSGLHLFTYHNTVGNRQNLFDIMLDLQKINRPTIDTDQKISPAMGIGTTVTIGCIRKNRAEALVNTPPLRPLVVLANIAPRITPGVMRLFGYTRTFERAIEIDSRR